MNKRLILSLLFALAASLPHAGLAAEPGRVLTNAFFAMDTGVRDGRHSTIQAQADLLKTLGYAGLGGSGYSGISEILRELEARGLKLFNVYLTLDFQSGRPALDPKLKALLEQLQGHDTLLWLAINGMTKDGQKLRTSNQEGDAVAEAALREIADFAQGKGVRIALYPHTGFWIERVEDALRVARKVERPTVGMTFNLCHWLKVEGDRDPQPVLKEALPLLFFVTINGADGGDTKRLNWDKLIQTLDRGSFDNSRFLRTLGDLGYGGPIGLQGYGIGGDVEDNLRRSMEAWRRMTGQNPPAR